MSIRSLVCRISTLVLGLALAGPAASQDLTTRESLSSAGTEGSLESGDPAISANGRYVAFVSLAGNLVIGDNNSSFDVFVRDRQTGQTTRVSIESAGNEANGNSGDNPWMSGDGRYVVFLSEATNLVAGDTNSQVDAFVHDRQTGLTTRVSVDSTGNQGNLETLDASISADGRYVAMASDATNLVLNDTNNSSDVFVHDRQTAQTTRVSVDSNGNESNGDSYGPCISSDNRYIGFTSAASNLDPVDMNGVLDVFLHDRQLSQTKLVSVDSAGIPGDDDSRDCSLSADGRYVAFTSDANNLVSSNPGEDIFRHDRQTGVTKLVSVDSNGALGNANSKGTSISADGRFVVFRSWATNFVAGDTNSSADVFVRDCQALLTNRVSVATGGNQGNGESDNMSISADGCYVVYSSESTDLVPMDLNGAHDVFVTHLTHCNPGSNYCTTTPNSVGSPATIVGSGSASVAANDLLLRAAPVPNQPGVFFYGPQQTSVPFGNGTLCITGQIGRLDVVNATGNVMVHLLDNTSPPSAPTQITPGSTWYFQAWFRDPAAGGAFFDLSNGLSVAFVP